ncbi:MAG: flagellar assembly protein FliH [Pseudomonadota bacterium]|jgi:flagellar assembly protein FliH|nr:flagellar assembly protein FliH [Pseudomonadota bacterium]
MKPIAPARIPAADVADAKRWLPPDVGVDAPVVQALARKPDTPLEKADVSVIEEEIFAEKLTLSQWEEICDEARREGYAEGVKEGREQGQKEGYQQGLGQGIEAGRAEIDARLEKLDALLEQLQQPIEQQREALEATLLKLVVALAEAAVKAELRQRVDLLARSVHEALDQLPQASGKVLLRVYPDQLAALEPLLDDSRLQLKPDESLSPGSCVVESGSCRVDYRTEERFAQVAEQLLARLISTPEPERDGNSN